MILLTVNAYNESARIYKWNTTTEQWVNYLKVDSGSNLQTHYTINNERLVNGDLQYLSYSIGLDQVQVQLATIAIVTHDNISQSKYLISEVYSPIAYLETNQKLFSIGNDDFLALTTRDANGTIHLDTDIYKYNSTTSVWAVLQTLTIKSTNVQYIRMDNVKLMVCVDNANNLLTYEYNSTNNVFNNLQIITGVKLLSSSCCSFQVTKHTDGIWYFALYAIANPNHVQLYKLNPTTKQLEFIRQFDTGSLLTAITIKSIDGKLLILASESYTDFLGANAGNNEKILRVYFILNDNSGTIVSNSTVTLIQQIKYTALTGMFLFDDGTSTYLIANKQYVANITGSTINNYQLIQYKYDNATSKFVQIPLVNNNFIGGLNTNFNFEISSPVLLDTINVNVYLPTDSQFKITLPIIGDACDNLFTSYTHTQTTISDTGYDVSHLTNNDGYFVYSVEGSNIIEVYRNTLIGTSDTNWYPYQVIELTENVEYVQTININNNILLYVLTVHPTTNSYSIHGYNYDVFNGFSHGVTVNALGNYPQLNVYSINNDSYLTLSGGVKFLVLKTTSQSILLTQFISFTNGVHSSYKYIKNGEHYLVCFGYMVDPSIVAQTKIFKWNLTTSMWDEVDSFDSNYYTNADHFNIDGNEFLCFSNGELNGNCDEHSAVLYVFNNTDQKFKPYQCFPTGLTNSVSYAKLNNIPSLIFSEYFDKKRLKVDGNSSIYEWDSSTGKFIQSASLDRRYNANIKSMVVAGSLTNVQFPLLIDVFENEILFSKINSDTIDRINVLSVGPNNINSFSYFYNRDLVNYLNSEIKTNLDESLVFYDLPNSLTIVYGKNSNLNSTLYPSGVNFDNTIETISYDVFMTTNIVPYSIVEYDPAFEYPFNALDSLIYVGLYPVAIDLPIPGNDNNIIPISDIGSMYEVYDYKYSGQVFLNSAFKFNDNKKITIIITNLENVTISVYVQSWIGSTGNEVKNYVIYNKNINPGNIITQNNICVRANSVIKVAANGNCNVHVFSI